MDWKYILGLKERGTTCASHKKQHFTVNFTLLALAVVAIAVMVYRVLTVGPVVEGVKGLKNMPFIKIMGHEMWATWMDGKGVFANLLVGNIWLYLLIGNMIASWIRTYKFHIRLRKTLIRYGFASILLATFIGVISPLCSCGILATVVGLLSTGLPLAPAMSLLISAPLMSPSTYMITIGDLGGEWALIRMLAATCMGLFAGLITYLFRKYFVMEEIFLEDSIPEHADFHDPNFAGDERLRCSCGDKFSNRVARETKSKWTIFWAKTLEMTWMIGKYVLIGLFVGNVVERYISADIIADLFSHGGIKSILYVTFGSIPLYLHQVSASSVLVHIKEALPGTLDKGAALAFLIGGPVTAIPAMTLLWAMFKKRVFILYMGISLVGTIVLSVFFAKFIFVPNVDASHPLFSGVSHISGGEASTLIKSEDKIKILVAPGKKNAVAVYDDTIMGESGIVFDSILSHYTSDSYDNSYYIKNVGDWLEKTVLNSQKAILIYSTYTGNGVKKENLTKKGSFKLLQKAYKVVFTDRSETSAITPQLIKGYSQLWIISGEKKSRGCFSESELETIFSFRDEGAGLLIVGGDKKKSSLVADANQVANEYSMTFSGYKRFSERLPISTLGKTAPGLLKYIDPIYTYMQKVGTESSKVSIILWEYIKKPFSFF